MARERKMTEPRTFRLSPGDVKRLKWLTRRTNISRYYGFKWKARSQTDTVRYALQLYEYLILMQDSGGSVALCDKEGRLVDRGNTRFAPPYEFGTPEWQQPQIIWALQQFKEEEDKED
jgi:hypothetical protein